VLNLSQQLADESMTGDDGCAVHLLPHQRALCIMAARVELLGKQRRKHGRGSSQGRGVDLADSTVTAVVLQYAALMGSELQSMPRRKNWDSHRILSVPVIYQEAETRTTRPMQRYKLSQVVAHCLQLLPLTLIHVTETEMYVLIAPRGPNI